MFVNSFHPSAALYFETEADGTLTGMDFSTSSNVYDESVGGVVALQVMDSNLLLEPKI